MNHSFALKAGRSQKRFTSLTINTSHDRFEIPIFIVRGKKDGPTLTIIGGEHGTEVTAPEIIRRFIEGINPEELSGGVIGIPVANPPAMRTKQHSFPYDKWVWWSELNDLNRAWPGQPDGTPAECITHALFNQVLLKSNAVISIHSTNYTHYVEADLSSRASRKLCLDFGRIALVRYTNAPGRTSFKAPLKYGIPSMLIEYAPLRHVNHNVIDDALIGLENLLVSMEMKCGKIRKIKDQFIVAYAKGLRIERVDAIDDGILVRGKPWGSHMRKGELIGHIYDLYKYRRIQEIKAPIEGILISTGPNPAHQSTFFMHTDSVCRGECVAEVMAFDRHIVNRNGDEWRDKLLATPS
ncbi:MAG: succinylglutamate desuccinylase/aspartoacylase family protein [Verrucomicrobia bacterium]|nr:succinylglutamate desuccinylase/aspartoacylase family protein [Verrucomicrobiota bacterium]MBU1734133.1 succinylglutamate desuccinylase/aspartoacylase family protein [Verrucomicrobiota bacterium]MBU1855383.1 succinylglutamate desuccinylase/aspartoacylase family protein [Verrucomicrobiota bacterium]